MHARRRHDWHCAHLLYRIKLPGNTHLHLLLRRLNDTRAFYGILLIQLVDDLIDIQARCCQTFLGELHKNSFALHTKQLHFGHILNAQQLLAHVIGKSFELCIAIAISREPINHAIHITKLIIKKWPLHPLRQGVAHIAHLFAHRIPKVCHILRPRVVSELENNLRLTRLGIAADLVCVRHFLQRALNLVRDLLCHLLGRRARPIGSHHHGTKSERRILILPQLKIGCPTEQQNHHHQIARQRNMLQRPTRQIEAFFFRRLVGSTHVFSPSSTRCIRMTRLVDADFLAFCEHMGASCHQLHSFINPGRNHYIVAIHPSNFHFACVHG